MEFEFTFVNNGEQKPQGSSGTPMRTSGQSIPLRLSGNNSPLPSSSLTVPVDTKIAMSSKSNQRNRSGSLGHDFQLPLSNLPPRGSSISMISPGSAPDLDLRSPGSGRSFNSATSAESDPELALRGARGEQQNFTPRQRSQSLSHQIFTVYSPNSLNTRAIPAVSVTSPRPSQHSPRHHSPRSPGIVPGLPSNPSPRSSSPRSLPGSQSPRGQSPRNLSKNDKRFPCPVPFCEAGYARRTVLLRHFNAKHSHLLHQYPDMRPDEVSCPVKGCTSTFLRKGNLIHHYRRFHPELTYQSHSSFRWIVENESGEISMENDFSDLNDEFDDMDVGNSDGYPNEFGMQFRDYVLDEGALLSLPNSSHLAASGSTITNSTASIDSTAQFNANSNVNQYDDLYRFITPESNSYLYSSAPNPHGHPQPNFSPSNSHSNLFNSNPRPSALLPTYNNNYDQIDMINQGFMASQNNSNPNLFQGVQQNSFSNPNMFQVPSFLANDFVSSSRSNSDESAMAIGAPQKIIPDDVLTRVSSDETIQMMLNTSMMDYSMQ